ncbi:MAG: polysaccharide deacetylase family protein [Bacilli bacterium]|nr:polysaccharide deacetylase family protein [Bacilli bacterium]
MSSRLSFKRRVKRFLKTKGHLSLKGAIILIVILSGILLFSIYELFLLPKIDLKGKEELALNYKAKYVEKGYKASYLGKDITSDVKTSGKVNTKKLGTYEIKYKAGKGIFKKTVTRTVIVEDLEKPKLDTNSDDIYVCPGEKVKAEKVKATDNYDGNITDKVKIKVSEDEVVYKVTDSSGNSKVITKKVLYKDIEKPVLTLNGNKEVGIFVGDKYSEAGVKAIDNCDGDLSSSVKSDSAVNTSKAGEYTINYNVKDKAGNEATITRKVRVNEKNRNGVVYLTFDDGPNSGTTDVILDILKSKGVKATFFVTNKGPDSLIKREFDEGHTVALHTASHDYAYIYSSEDNYFKDLNSVGARVKRITGQESKIIRFPGGASNTISRRYSQGIMSRLTKAVVAKGYRYYDWNVSSGDAGSTTDPNQVYLNVVNSLSRDRANMVLMHDIKPYTRDALARIIDYCKNNGYPMERITMSTEMVTQRVNN